MVGRDSLAHRERSRALVISVARAHYVVAAKISGDALRGALNQCPTLSDILLQALFA